MVPCAVPASAASKSAWGYETRMVGVRTIPYRTVVVSYRTLNLIVHINDNTIQVDHSAGGLTSQRLSSQQPVEKLARIPNGAV